MSSARSAGFVVVEDSELLDIESLISFSDEEVAGWFYDYGSEGNGGEGDASKKGIGKHTGFVSCCV